jgi:hypothetical protein
MGYFAGHGDYLRPEPLLTPVRYRVGGWPPPDVMAALLAQAVT